MRDVGGGRQGDRRRECGSDARAAQAPACRGPRPGWCLAAHALPPVDAAIEEAIMRRRRRQWKPRRFDAAGAAAAAPAAEGQGAQASVGVTNGNVRSTNTAIWPRVTGASGQ
ncbi:MAG: hypothetical protein BroJett026_38450 [Betaproteobacteria bacterium]|nr:MAG: hypothetical protein BroJett026_38450 [Betaproteobacteria bacterium]